MIYDDLALVDNVPPVCHLMHIRVCFDLTWISIVIGYGMSGDFLNQT